MPILRYDQVRRGQSSMGSNGDTAIRGVLAMGPATEAFRQRGARLVQADDLYRDAIRTELRHRPVECGDR